MRNSINTEETNESNINEQYARALKQMRGAADAKDSSQKNLLPQIERRGSTRVSSSGLLGGVSKTNKNSLYSTSMAVLDENGIKSPQDSARDPFARVNKF
jgi:trimethylamine:corrinoid methyltransferase-like protein